MNRIADLTLYAITLFVGAALLFVVQPMVGKMILPLLGGTPAVRPRYTLHGPGNAV